MFGGPGRSDGPGGSCGPDGSGGPRTVLKHGISLMISLKIWIYREKNNNNNMWRIPQLT